MFRLLRSARTLIAIPLALTLVAAMSLGLSMDNAVADNDPDGSHPAHLHTGTCESPGEIVAPLSNVSREFLVDDTASAGSEQMGPTTAIPVKASVTSVALGLADIVSGGHALVVHESDANIDNYIACGDVGGVMLGDSDLPIGLAELNDSDYFGNAWLRDNGDGTTTVTVFILHSDLVEGDGMEDMDHDMDDDDDSAAVPAAPAVSIEGRAFNPPLLEIAVGDTVTWTNNDPTPHTATQDPSGSGFQSGTLSQGGAFSHTFEEAGTFDYFCEFHGQMSGTIVVS